MPEILGFAFTEEARSRLSVACGVIQWICIIGSLMLMGIGAYIKLTVDEFLALVEGYSADTLPYMLVGVGLLSLILNAGGGLLFVLSSDPKRRKALKVPLLAYCILSAIMCVLMFAGGIMCYTHINHLEDSFKGGLISAMQKYKSDAYLKEEVDRMQMQFSCCGNDAYTDWFVISWIHEDYINVQSRRILQKLESGPYTHDDVPFSCCSAKAHRPCIHHNVQNNKKHYNYDYRSKTTLNTMGCRKSLMNYLGDEMLIGAGIAVLAIFALQIIMTILGRYVQTAMATSLKGDDPEGKSRGYLCLCGGKKEDKTPPPDAAEAALLPPSGGDEEFTDYGDYGEYQDPNIYMTPTRHSQQSLRRQSLGNTNVMMKSSGSRHSRLRTSQPSLRSSWTEQQVPPPPPPPPPPGGFGGPPPPPIPPGGFGGPPF